MSILHCANTVTKPNDLNVKFQYIIFELLVTVLLISCTSAFSDQRESLDVNRSLGINTVGTYAYDGEYERSSNLISVFFLVVDLRGEVVPDMADVSDLVFADERYVTRHRQFHLRTERRRLHERVEIAASECQLDGLLHVDGNGFFGFVRFGSLGKFYIRWERNLERAIVSIL